MKALMERSDGPAIRDTIIWLVAFVSFGIGGHVFWGTWPAVPFIFCYDVLYGSSSDSRWHECGHGTIVGRDPEIAAMRPPAMFQFVSNMFAAAHVWSTIKSTILRACGRLTTEEQGFVPETEWRKVKR